MDSAWIVRQRWWMTRIAVFPIHILFFAVLVFFFIRVIPGDPVQTLTGGNATPEEYELVREQLGLNVSIFQQLIAMLVGLLTLDLGTSWITRQPVASELLDRLPATIELSFIALFFIVVITLLTSFVAVRWPKSPPGRLLHLYARAAGALPEFSIGVLGIFVFYAVLHWSPAPIGRVSTGLPRSGTVTGFPVIDAILAGNGAELASMASHLVLPIAVLVVSLCPLLLKLLISGLDVAIEAAPTRFKIATGAPRTQVVLSIYRRALPAAVTLLGTLFGNLLGGAVIVESLFSLGGIGQYAVDSVNTGDLIALQAFLLLSAIICLAVFLLTDVVNMLLDPRRRPGVMVSE